MGLLELGCMELAFAFSCPQSQIPSGVLHCLKVADYLLIAKPVATSHLGIRSDCAIVLTDFGRLWVVLSKGRHLSLSLTGGSVLEICEIGG